MLMILEQFYVDMANHIHSGMEEDRVILYHPSPIEELLKRHKYAVLYFTDLLTDKMVVMDNSQFRILARLYTEI